MDRIFISATAQHAGKTTTSLGLYKLFEKLGKSVNYIKPVGQRSLTYMGHVVDEDAVLFKENLKCKTPIEAMTAVTVPRGFTEQYIFNRNKAQIYDDIDQAIMQLDEDTDVTIIEGTGHAGVGSVFDASNATVACLLGAKAVIIVGGGIGKCLDQIALNHALFLQENVELLGVVINKVLLEKYEKINRTIRQGLKNMGIKCLGVIPYTPELTFPTVEQLTADCKLQLLSGNEIEQSRHIRKNLVATLPLEKLKMLIREDTLLIIPGGYSETLLIDNITTMNNTQTANISAILFADNIIPSDRELQKLKSCHIPAIFTTKDTFTISAMIADLIVKISPKDKIKVINACQLMEKYLNMDAIVNGLQEKQCNFCNSRF